MNGRRGEEGSAVVEFVFLGVLLLIPLIYLVLTVARLQAASFAVSTASREAGRAFVTAPKQVSPQARAETAARMAYADHGFDSGKVTVRCAANPCLTPDARIEVHAAVDVPLPLLPAFLSDAWPLTVRVDGSYGATVDRFRER
ncbi:pilus assembly protein [Austwickia chelonae]|uniref:pilus assembly protein n=1 Tax=Austwickia chelonae TaxID=100225 RepID=UPI001F08862A|nr:pilus assembly protein [Austwickia chelonae]